MARPKSKGPTERERAILRVLWDRGPSTVREVHETLAKRSDTGYTTTLKQLQIMAAKGLVARDESVRSHVYRARLNEERAQRQLVRNLLDHVFGGSAEKLVMHALEAKRAKPEELAQIRKFLDELEGGKR